MRLLVGLLLLVASTAPAVADDRGRGRDRGADVDVVVPVDPYEHQRMYWSDGQEHHSVPGTVTINGSPYICDLDGARFTDRDAFLYHLRRAHHVDPSRASQLMMVRDGRVHFVGE
jgi:hypothetical protein